MSYYGQNDYRNYLAHYGVLGMKWGHRKTRTYSGNSKKKVNNFYKKHNATIRRMAARGVGGALGAKYGLTSVATLAVADIALSKAHNKGKIEYKKQWRDNNHDLLIGSLTGTAVMAGATAVKLYLSED